MAGDRYNDEKFIGWLKVNLSLIFAKEGVEQFSDDEVQTFHDNIKRNIPSSSAPGPHTCIDNTQSRQDNKRKLTQEWQKGRFSCQADQCHLWLGGIRKEYLGSPKSVEWDNSDLTQLSTDPWACAKLHMPYGSASYTQASDADIASLLTLFLRCNHFSKFFSQVDVCQKVKDIRNKMMHTCKMEVDAASVTAYTTQIIEFLEDPKHLLHQPPCQEAVRKIKELLSGKTEISLNREREILNIKIGSLVAKVEGLGKQVQDLTNTAQTTTTDVSSNTGELQKLKSELGLVKSRSEVFNQFINDNKIKGVSTEKLSEVNTNISSLQTQIQTQMKELTGRVAKLEIHCKTLTKEQSGQKQRLEEVSQEQGSQKQRLDQLETDVSQEQGSQRRRLNQLEMGHSAVSKEQGGQKLKLQQLETGISDVSKEQGGQKLKLQQLETGISDVSKEQGGQKLKLQQLETGISDVSKEQGGQKLKLQQLETDQLAVSKEQGGQKLKLQQLETDQLAVSKEQGGQKLKLQQLETDQLAVSKEQGGQKLKLQQLETDQLAVSKEQGSQKLKLQQLETDKLAVSEEQGDQKLKLHHLETGISAVSKEQDGQKQRLDDLETGISDVTLEQRQLKRVFDENLVTKESSCKDIQHRLIALYKKECQTITIYPLQPEWRTHVASLFVLPSMKVTNPRGISKHLLMRETDGGSNIKVTSIEDIFPPAGSSCTDIYIMGDAGTGKSTLCEYLVHLWVNCHTSSNQAPEAEKTFMEKFEFLFFISLREATSCNVEEMIKSQLQLKDVNISRLLYDHSSLIILDGLDEYSLKQTSRTRFGSENVPYRDHSDKCTVLTTSRPWKLELLRREIEHKIDRQISIVGLDTKSQKKLVGRVADLLNSEKKYEKNPEDFITEVQTQGLDKFMNTPVLVVQMLGLWFSGEPLEGSKCSIYAKLIDKQIQFAEEIRGLSLDPQCQNTAANTPEVQTTQKDLFPTYFENYIYIMRCKNLLQKVSRFAYFSLTSKDKENSLVFSHEQMELFDMSLKEILLCLHLGLLTQYKVLGEITQRLKWLSFVHKSHQEFFAAMYLSQIDEADEVKQLLERDFTSLEHILEMGIVFMFVCGMNPTLARDISSFIMFKASGDARLEQYRQYSYDWFATEPNTALVMQLQGLILASIEEGRHNGHKIKGMQLQDLYMDVTEQDCPPARVLACTGSLDLSHVKSLYIEDKGAISRDELQQLLKETSKSLHKLVLWDTVVSVETIQTVVKQNKGRLHTLGLIGVNVDNVDISHLNQDKLQAILSAPTKSLTLQGLVLTHSQLEVLCQHVSTSSYGEVYLGNLQCTTHGYRGTECKQRLDLSANRNLSRLVLYKLPVNEVRFVPENLVWCYIAYLPEPVATSCISCLQRAEKLEALRCVGLRGSTVVELSTTMPHLVHLQLIVLHGINLSGQQQIVRAVAQLKKLEYIGLWRVTMREEDLRELLAALPSSHRVEVELGYSSGSFPVTITDCNRHTNLLEHIRHNPHTHVYSDQVEIEGDTCIVKHFLFYIDPGCCWVTAAAAPK